MHVHTSRFQIIERTHKCAASEPYSWYIGIHKDPFYKLFSVQFVRSYLWGKGVRGWKKIVLRYTSPICVCLNERFSIAIRAKFESVLALVFMTMLYGFKDAFWLKIQLSCELKWHQLTYAILFILNAYSWMHLNITENVRLCSFSRSTLVTQSFSFCVSICVCTWMSWIQRMIHRGTHYNLWISWKICSIHYVESCQIRCIPNE